MIVMGLVIATATMLMVVVWVVVAATIVVSMTLGVAAVITNANATVATVNFLFALPCLLSSQLPVAVCPSAPNAASPLG